MTIKHTADWSDEAVTRHREICSALAISPLHLLEVMYSESGCYAHAHNSNGDASGLIQFMPFVLEGLGWPKGHSAFRKLSAFDQLPYVQRYFAPKAPHVLNTAARVYVATFLPALLPVAHDDEYVLCGRMQQLGWAYEANSGFDRNKDLVITVGELQQAIERSCQGARWEELKSRVLGLRPDVPDEDEPPLDVRTPRGLQRALKALGFDVGPIDGLIGPKTRLAVIEFQKAHGLVADGIVGPITRDWLGVALLTLRRRSC